MLIRLGIGLAVTVGLFAASACSSSEPSVDCNANGAAATVNATGSNAFSPANVTVQAGQSLCWRNTSSTAHTVTADGGAFDSSLPGNSIFVRDFPTAGVFPYHCEIHAGMAGTVTVQ
jgi:plastocyanin